MKSRFSLVSASFVVLAAAIGCGGSKDGDVINPKVSDTTQTFTPGKASGNGGGGAPAPGSKSKAGPAAKTGVD